MLRARRALLELARDRLSEHHPQLRDLASRELGRCLLTSAKVARKAGQVRRIYLLPVCIATDSELYILSTSCLKMDKAFNLLANAERGGGGDGGSGGDGGADGGADWRRSLFVEWAKLHWARGEREEAIAALKDGIRRHFPKLAAAAEGGGGEGVGANGDGGGKRRRNTPAAAKLGMWSHGRAFSYTVNRMSYLRDVHYAASADCPAEERRECASAKLLLARYVDEAANLEAESVPRLYSEARSLSIGPADAAEAHYHMARFYDKVVGKNYRPADLVS